MPTIIERSGRFMARVRVQGFRPVSKTFHRKPDAIAWGRTVEADMQAGRWKEEAEEVPTVRDALKTYRQQVVSKLKGADTYAYWLDELLSAPFAHKPVDTVTAADVSAWRDKLALSVKPGTVCRKLGLLSGFFTWAEKDCGWLSSNPVRSIRKPSANDARDRTVTPEELAYIRQAAASSRAKWLGDVLTILQTSAMRRGELWGLKVGAVDFDACTAHLSDTKNGSARDVPLCPTALAALRRLQDSAERRRGDTLVPVASAHAVSLAFRRTLERARAAYEKDCGRTGVKPSPGFLADLRLHDFRHHAVSSWAATGALSVVELMAISGHKSPRMLARYTHLSASSLAGKLATLQTG